MTENTDKEHVDNNSNIESENASDAILSVQDNPFINSNPKSENMEVHKHPHHLSHKKKWTEYLLEFFMLFFAVFLGFIAENWREHLVENKKEKEYMHSLVLDLKTDTSMITGAIKYNQNIYEAGSTVLSLLNAPGKDSQTLRKLYQLNPVIQNFNFQINDSKTFDQLKSSGDYRLIKNKEVLSSIAKYYQRISSTKIFSNEIQRNLEYTYTFSNKIFDQYTFDNNVNTTVPLLTNDVILLKEYSNNLYSLGLSYKIYSDQFLEKIKKEAINLIILLNKEYP
jgi:hypothetical protein